MKSLFATSFALATMAVHAAPGKAASAPPPPPAVDTGGYVFAELKMPEKTRGAGVGEPSKLAKALNAVPLSRSFLEAVEVPATITDATERDKAFKAEARKVQNRIGGAIRRLHKTYPERNFGMLTVNDPGTEADGKLGVGVRVWRLDDSTPEQLAEKAKKAAEAKAAKATPPPPPAPTV